MDSPDRPMVDKAAARPLRDSAGRRTPLLAPLIARGYREAASPFARPEPDRRSRLEALLSLEGLPPALSRLRARSRRDGGPALPRPPREFAGMDHRRDDHLRVPGMDDGVHYSELRDELPRHRLGHDRDRGLRRRAGDLLRPRHLPDRAAVRPLLLLPLHQPQDDSRGLGPRSQIQAARLEEQGAEGRGGEGPAALRRARAADRGGPSLRRAGGSRRRGRRVLLRPGPRRARGSRLRDAEDREADHAARGRRRGRGRGR